MKKALVAGGASGIGLAPSLNLIERGYIALVLDIAEPEVKPHDMQYRRCDLSYFDDELFEELSCDAEIECLAITAGFGRVARFESLHSLEIGRLMAVNATAAIKIARIFYGKTAAWPSSLLLRDDGLNHRACKLARLAAACAARSLKRGCSYASCIW